MQGIPQDPSPVPSRTSSASFDGVAASKHNQNAKNTPVQASRLWIDSSNVWEAMRPDASQRSAHNSIKHTVVRELRVRTWSPHT